MRCHGVGRKPIQIEVWNPRLFATSLQIVSLLLCLPAFRAAPLFRESLAVRLDEGFGLVVLGFEKEGDPQDGKGQRTRRIGKGRTEDLLDRTVQELLPNVPCRK